MNLLFRLLFVVITAIVNRFASFEDIYRACGCAYCPNDLDFNLHMNNGRYYALLDLGKVDVMIRLGLATVAWKKNGDQ